MGEFDNTMKMLVDADPKAFATFILSQARRSGHPHLAAATIRSVERLNPEFQGDKTEADGLLLIDSENAFRYLMQIKVQTKKHPFMPLRQLDYCVRAKKKNIKEHRDLPILPAVIYLRKESNIQESPYQWPFLGWSMMDFHYVCIKLWELESEDLFALQQPVLLPLAPQTNGGNNRIVCKRVFEELLANQLYNLLPITEAIAGLSLKGNDQELEWLYKEYRKMVHEFQDSPAFEWMTQTARELGREEGRELGREEERERSVQSQREMLLFYIEEHFPGLRAFAEQQVKLVNDVERLKTLARRLFATDEADAARQLLIEAVGH